MDEFALGSMAAADAIVAFLRRSGHSALADQVLGAWNDGTLVGGSAAATVDDPLALAPTPAPRTVARQHGYTGDQCNICNSLRMKRNGACLVCEECGATTGCS